ncbi:MAG: branched-chain amino acid aminotransferase [Deltaproteobacteria bacterium]|nr:branched-chain amino acid aminotransferase [Myxococcales bacterium]MDP3214441.1 branched-chain amino acid aminotransferase [Deltaproteobacteria bacterium]
MKLEVRIERTRAPKAHPPESELGFGRHFTDHMLLVDFHDGRGWSDARVVPYGPLSLDPAAAVLHYGQAMFEGAKAIRGDDGAVRLFRLERHCERMASGAPRLCMPSPDPEMLAHAITELVKVEEAWVPRARNTALYIRPTLVATEPFLGVRPANQYLLYVILSPVGSYYGGDTLKPVRIWVETQQTRAAKGGLGAVKAGANYASSLQAAMRAKKEGYDQVLWLDGAKHEMLEEVGTMNLFLVLGDELVTPALGDTILSGVTRDCILTLARARGIKVTERPLSLAEIIAAHDSGKLKEVFGSGTAAVVSPVSELVTADRRMIVGDGVGPIGQSFYDELTAIQRGAKRDEHGWLTTL